MSDRAPPLGPKGGVLLCADDFAMTQGVSRAIIELAEAGRLSATSAMTTSPHWPAHATWLARARGRISCGLHLNLTLGAPLGPMPNFAAGRQFPGISEVTSRALTGRIDQGEVRAEVARQLAAFEVEMGFAPDHVDGHQHVHALPGVRSAVLDVLKARFDGRDRWPLLRDPADAAWRITARRRACAKAAMLAALSSGFARTLKHSGFETNDGFAGVTDFDERGVGADFAAACRATGPRHMVMCHPGYVDEELRRLDPVTGRRQAEYDILMQGGFPNEIWRPQRSPVGEAVAWRDAWRGTA